MWLEVCLGEGEFSGGEGTDLRQSLILQKKCKISIYFYNSIRRIAYPVYLQGFELPCTLLRGMGVGRRVKLDHIVHLHFTVELQIVQSSCAYL